MRRSFSVWSVSIGLCMMLATHVEAAAVPTKNELFSQQLEIYETKKELQDRTHELQRITHQVHAQQTQIDAHREEVEHSSQSVLDTAIAAYSGRSLSFLEMVFSAKSTEQLFTSLYFMQKKNEEESQKLTASQTKLTAFNEKKQALQRKKRTLQQQNHHLQSLLSQLHEQEKNYEANVALRPDVEQARRDAADFMNTWETKATPAFTLFFKQTSHYVGQLDELLTKRHVHKKGFFSYEVRLRDKEFTQFLRKKDPLYKDVTFLFQGNHLIVKGTVDGVHLNMKGTYALQEKTVQFSFVSIEMNGVSLPKGTVQRFQQQYPLTLDPASFYPGLHIQRVSLQKGTLIMGVTF